MYSILDLLLFRHARRNQDVSLINNSSLPSHEASVRALPKVFITSLI